MGKTIGLKLPSWATLRCEGGRKVAECKFCGVSIQLAEENFENRKKFRKHASGTRHIFRACPKTNQLRQIRQREKAPSVPDYQQLFQLIRKGSASAKDGVPGVAKAKKALKMYFSVHQAMKRMDLRWISKAASMSLFRDERKSRLVIRFRACRPGLTVKSGVMGLLRDHGTGASGITKGTIRICFRISSDKYCNLFEYVGFLN